jgi:hypothetical protein
MFRVTGQYVGTHITEAGPFLYKRPIFLFFLKKSLVSSYDVEAQILGFNSLSGAHSCFDAFGGILFSVLLP